MNTGAPPSSATGLTCRRWSRSQMSQESIWRAMRLRMRTVNRPSQPLRRLANSGQASGLACAPRATSRHPDSVRRSGAAGTSWCSRWSASPQEFPPAQGRPVRAGRTDPAVRGRGLIVHLPHRRPDGLIRSARQAFPCLLGERPCQAIHQRPPRGSGAEDGASHDGGRSSTAMGGVFRVPADLRGLSRQRRRCPARSRPQRHGPRPVRRRSHKAGRRSGHRSPRMRADHRQQPSAQFTVAEAGLQLQCFGHDANFRGRLTFVKRKPGTGPIPANIARQYRTAEVSPNKLGKLRGRVGALH